MTDRYDYMEETLKCINRNFIRLKEQVVLKNTTILKEILDELIAICKDEDSMFKRLYQDLFYGGSFYDGVRIGQPEEFDLNFKLKIPREFPVTLCTSNIPGYVNLKMRSTDYPQDSDEFDRFRRLLFSDRYFMSTISVLSWMESLLVRALDKLVTPFMITLHKRGPALTLKIRDNGDPDFIIDIDLVPCFIFEDWPVNGFEQPDHELDKKEFFAIPKAPKKSRNREPKYRYFRLSFQPQEREIMKDLQCFKPAFRLIKKLRDRRQHQPVASYYIKNVLLWIIHEQPNSFWNNSLSHVFITVLKRYEEFISDGNIPYYWYKKNRLLENVKPKTLANIGNNLKKIVKDIDANIGNDLIVAKHLLNNREYLRFKGSYSRSY